MHALAALCFLLVLLGSASSAAAEDESQRLHAILAEEWETRLGEDPLLASSVGDHRWDDRLPSVTSSDLKRRAAFARSLLDRLAGGERWRLSTADRISFDMFERELREGLAEVEFGTYRIPINSDSGFHIGLAQLPRETRFSGVADYEAYLARLTAIPAYFDQQIAHMREGLAAGFTLPRVVLDGYDASIRAHLVEDPEASAFYAPFKAFPAGVPSAEHARLRAAGRAAVAGGVIPAYRVFLDFFLGEYVPGARASTGASELPRGRELYAHLVRSFTTLEVTPAEVHGIGQREVARIRTEMEAVVKRVGFKGEFASFLDFLRTDPRFYADTPEELLKEASRIAKRMDGKLPSLFKTLPRLPYGVEPVPPEIAPKYTGGRYVPAPVGGTRAGTYWVNTYALNTRPLYTLESLTLHEAVPGHHLQIALQQELTGLPPFRRFSGIGAFVEGWALYSERLGLEAGFYQDPYSDFGRLTYEMWRACRLVVDTGLHAMGWTRQQAMDFMAANTALSLHEIRTETDRYIAWPGQALGYKMGELKIRELRERAERALGNRFDVRDFHDAVLANGPVPLSVLEQQVDAFIASRP